MIGKKIRADKASIFSSSAAHTSMSNVEKTRGSEKDMVIGKLYKSKLKKEVENSKNRTRMLPNLFIDDSKINATAIHKPFNSTEVRKDFAFNRSHQETEFQQLNPFDSSVE